MNSFWAMYSLRFVLERAREAGAGHAALLGGGDEERPDDGRGAVDGHGGGDAVQRQSLQQEVHVGQRIDGHAAGAEFALGPGFVVVVAHERGHVEGDGEAVVAGRQQVVVALVRLLHGAKAAEHADGPGLAAVAGAVDAAREGVGAGQVDVALVVEAGHVGGVVEPLNGAARDGHEGAGQLAALGGHGLVVGLAQFARALQFVPSVPFVHGPLLAGSAPILPIRRVSGARALAARMTLSRPGSAGGCRARTRDGVGWRYAGGVRHAQGG